MKTHFGTAGNTLSFFNSKFGKDTLNAPEWINSIGLNAYERQMTYGARMKKEDALALGKNAKKFDVQLSVHGPYYVVLNSKKADVRGRSRTELLKTARLGKMMGAKKIIFHPGFGDDISPIISSLKKIEADRPKGVFFCPETMGKMSQSGSLGDVMEICEKTECKPCIDFGHLHARNLGSLKKEEGFRKIVIEIEDRLGKTVLKDLHCHFYPIEFGEKGEKKHRAVTEKNVFPRFEPFAELIKEFKMHPTLISESRDSQDIGALQMKKILGKLKYS
ncbi:endonuclease IV [Candidatus Pacearchaeota archaeon]|nr:endonuclease IV [Candidatus Pacearchaeota archaeon]